MQRHRGAQTTQHACLSMCVAGCMRTQHLLQDGGGVVCKETHTEPCVRGSPSHGRPSAWPLARLPWLPCSMCATPAAPSRQSSRTSAWTPATPPTSTCACGSAAAASLAGWQPYGWALRGTWQASQHACRQPSVHARTRLRLRVPACAVTACCCLLWPARAQIHVFGFEQLAPLRFGRMAIKYRCAAGQGLHMQQPACSDVRLMLRRGWPQARAPAGSCERSGAICIDGQQRCCLLSVAAAAAAACMAWQCCWAGLWSVSQPTPSPSTSR